MDDIAPLQHIHKSITYTCTGQGLYKDGHPYDTHPEKFIPPKTPKSSKAGSPIEAPNVDKKPVAWWKAQCAFRGLNQSGAIGDMQLRIKEAKAKMLPELKEAETRLNKEYKKLVKTASDGKWKNLKTAEQKAEKDPKKFLTEVFPKGDTGRPADLDIVVVKIASRTVLADAAEKMGLESVTVDAPMVAGKKPNPDRWIIVGRTRDAVWNQMRQIERKSLPKEKSAAQAKTTSKAKPTPKQKSATTEKAQSKEKLSKQDKPVPKEKVTPKRKEDKPKIGGASLIVSCSNCDKVIYDQYYHCNTCSGGNFDLCLDCLKRGFRCSDDRHRWVRRVMRNGMGINTGGAIAPKDAIAAYTQSIGEPAAKKRQVGKAIAAPQVQSAPKKREAPKVTAKPTPGTGSSKRKREGSYEFDEDGDIVMRSLPQFMGDRR